MFTSARLLSRFANYERAFNDRYDQEWSSLLRDSGSVCSSVHLRPCIPSVSLEIRFITENELISRILACDMRAAFWFAQQFEQLTAAIVKGMPIGVQDRHEISHNAFVILCEHDSRRLRQWRARGKGRLTPFLSTLIRRTAFNWLRKHSRPIRHSNGNIIDCVKPDATCLRSSYRASGRSRRVQMSTGPAGRPASYYPSVSFISSAPILVIETEALTKLLERNRAIRRAVTEMLQRDAELIRRCYFLGQTHAEIAEAMGMPADSVGAAVSRAKKRMHNKLRLRYPELF